MKLFVGHLFKLLSMFSFGAWSNSEGNNHWCMDTILF